MRPRKKHSPDWGCSRPSIETACLVPGRRKFTVLGDAGIHAKVGQEFWDKISSAMSKEFRATRFTEGLIHAIAEAGKQLAAHFPADPTQERNELPNEVDI